MNQAIALTEQEIWNRSIPEPNTGCWIWLGSFRDRGKRGLYGSFMGRLASRAAFIARNGYDPVGLDVDHRCTNTWCVNPDHLQAITHAENCRLRGARMVVCHKGHELPPVRYRSDGTAYKRRCPHCAKEWNSRHRSKLKGASNVPGTR